MLYPTDYESWDPPPSNHYRYFQNNPQHPSNFSTSTPAALFSAHDSSSGDGITRSLQSVFPTQSEFSQCQLQIQRNREQQLFLKEQEHQMIMEFDRQPWQGQRPGDQTYGHFGGQFGHSGGGSGGRRRERRGGRRRDRRGGPAGAGGEGSAGTGSGRGQQVVESGGGGSDGLSKRARKRLRQAAQDHRYQEKLRNAEAAAAAAEARKSISLQWTVDTLGVGGVNSSPLRSAGRTLVNFPAVSGFGGVSLPAAAGAYAAANTFEAGAIDLEAPPKKRSRKRKASAGGQPIEDGGFSSLMEPRHRIKSPLISAQNKMLLENPPFWLTKVTSRGVTKAFCIFCCCPVYYPKNHEKLKDHAKNFVERVILGNPPTVNPIVQFAHPWCTTKPKQVDVGVADDDVAKVDSEVGTKDAEIIKHDRTLDSGLNDSVNGGSVRDAVEKTEESGGDKEEKRSQGFWCFVCSMDIISTTSALRHHEETKEHRKKEIQFRHLLPKRDEAVTPKAAAADTASRSVEGALVKGNKHKMPANAAELHLTHATKERKQKKIEAETDAANKLKLTDVDSEVSMKATLKAMVKAVDSEIRTGFVIDYKGGLTLTERINQFDSLSSGRDQTIIRKRHSRSLRVIQRYFKHQQTKHQDNSNLAAAGFENSKHPVWLIVTSSEDGKVTEYRCAVCPPHVPLVDSTEPITPSSVKFSEAPAGGDLNEHKHADTSRTVFSTQEQVEAHFSLRTHSLFWVSYLITNCKWQTKFPWVSVLPRKSSAVGPNNSSSNNALNDQFPVFWCTRCSMSIDYDKSWFGREEEGRKGSFCANQYFSQHQKIYHRNVKEEEKEEKPIVKKDEETI